jgi:cysteine-rich repeat protein
LNIFDNDAVEANYCDLETCTLTKGWYCYDSEDCDELDEVYSECGDGITTLDEECDDGNDNFNDGCNACLLEDGFECNTLSTFTKCKSICGDNLKRGNEECDDDNTVGGRPVSKDGCSSRCKLEAGYYWDQVYERLKTECGDGLIRGNEECEIDDNDNLSAMWCDSDCMLEDDAFCYYKVGEDL